MSYFTYYYGYPHFGNGEQRSALVYIPQNHKFSNKHIGISRSIEQIFPLILRLKKSCKH